MLFNSPLFILFFLPVFLGVYYLTPNRFKNGVLLIASLGFYMWGAPRFAYILVASGLLDFFLSQKLNGNRGKMWLIAGVSYNIATLALFKYFNFFIDSIQDVFGVFGLQFAAHYEVFLPIGISFFTFQKISYLIDVYRVDCKPARSWHEYLLFVCLFPQLIAGPIIRYKYIVNQIINRSDSENWTNRLSGLYRFIIGLSKKVLIADALIPLVNASFNMPESIDAGTAWIGLLAYTIQIYFDFSGYSDMAIGLGQMMGFHFPENFHWPYQAKGFRDFWNRWHMTLSQFMRDYLYIPLGGNRLKPILVTRNLWIVFLLSGLWHGANWTFVIWGAWHGLFLTLDRFSAFFKAIPVSAARLLSFLLVMLGWVWFRSETLAESLAYIVSLVGTNGWVWPDVSNREGFILVMGIIFSVITLKNWSIEGIYKSDNSIHDVWKSALMCALLILCLGQLGLEVGQPFIYFRF